MTLTLQQLIDKIKTGEFKNLEEIYFIISDDNKLPEKEFLSIPGYGAEEKAKYLLSTHGKKSLFPEEKHDNSTGSLYRVKHLPKATEEKTLTVEEILKKYLDIYKLSFADFGWLTDAMQEYSDQQNRELKLEIEEKNIKISNLENLLSIDHNKVDFIIKEQELESLRKKCDRMEVAIKAIIPRVDIFAGLKKETAQLKESLTEDKKGGQND